jgi:carboxylate-amine ligase
MGASVEDSYAALDAAREHFADATDFTIGIEEEFQILDGASLRMTNRFEDLRDACEAGALQGNVAGELIASEIEVKTGRGETFDDAARMIIDRRVSLVEEAERMGLAVGATGTHPTSPWTEQRIIDTPHYQIVEGTLRYIAWRNNTFGMHVHVGIRGADRAIAVSNHMREHVPVLLALSCTSPWLEGRITHLRSTRTQIFTRMFPRCGIPDIFADWADYDRYVRFLLTTASIREHTEIWWTVRPHQSFGTIEVRACDALPELGESIALAALQTALAARAARLYDEGSLGAPRRPSDLEENLWRALRWGTTRPQLDLDARCEVDCADYVRDLLERCGPEIAALGLAPWLAPLEGLLQHGDHASRWKQRVESGEEMTAIHAEQVEITMASARRLQEEVG